MYAIRSYYDIDEQVEEEASFTTIINKLKMVGTSPMGLYQLDKELGGRQGFTPVITSYSIHYTKLYEFLIKDLNFEKVP